VYASERNTITRDLVLRQNFDQVCCARADSPSCALQQHCVITHALLSRVLSLTKQLFSERAYTLYVECNYKKLRAIQRIA
jgi:hypothetical protein